jgi:hypothetical protein
LSDPRTQGLPDHAVTTFLRHHPSFGAGPRGQSLESLRQQLILPRTVHALALGATGQSAWVSHKKSHFECAPNNLVEPFSFLETNDAVGVPTRRNRRVNSGNRQLRPGTDIRVYPRPGLSAETLFSRLRSGLIKSSSSSNGGRLWVVNAQGTAGAEAEAQKWRNHRRRV